MPGVITYAEVVLHHLGDSTQRPKLRWVTQRPWPVQQQSNQPVPLTGGQPGPSARMPLGRQGLFTSLLIAVSPAAYRRPRDAHGLGDLSSLHSLVQQGGVLERNGRLLKFSGGLLRHSQRIPYVSPFAVDLERFRPGFYRLHVPGHAGQGQSPVDHRIDVLLIQE